MKLRFLLGLGVFLLLGAVPSAASPGLIHWWKADGDTVDSVAANNGTLMGDTTFGPGNSGQAFSFDGNGDTVSVPAPNPDDHLFSGSFTVDAWVKTTQTSSLHYIIEKYECANLCPSGNANSDWELYLLDGNPQGYVRDTDAGGPDPGGGQPIGSAVNVADGTFHHVTLARDLAVGALCLIVDGQSAVSQPLTPGASGPLTSTDGEEDPLTIGAHVIGGTSTLAHELQGLVDDVQLFDTGTCPTPTAVNVIRFTAHRSASGTVLRWRTGQEAAVLGFSLYRDGTRVNRRLVAAHGGVAGARYRVNDRRTGAVYRLQAVHIDGSREWVARATTQP
jgi:hypothetical protein